MSIKSVSGERTFESNGTVRQGRQLRSLKLLSAGIRTADDVIKAQVGVIQDGLEGLVTPVLMGHTVRGFSNILKAVEIQQRWGKTNAKTGIKELTISP